MKRIPFSKMLLIVLVVVFSLFLSYCSGIPEKCYDTDPHPIGTKIAENYDVAYARVMIWYCRGSAFDDIILALETHDLVPEVETETLLEMRASDQTWDQIWREIGLTD